MKIFPLLLLCLAAFAPKSEAATAYSGFLKRIQEKYLKDAAPYPILIMDRDEIEWRFLQAKADAKKREQIIQEYVFEKTGVRITENAASNFETSLTTLKDSAMAMPALTDDYPRTLQVCAVFPADPNRNQRLEIERLLQMGTPEVYGNLGVDQMVSRMSYDDLILFSLLHEAGHCMDQTFFAAVYQGQEDAHSIHESEAFAEATAVLLMAKEGRADIAHQRADLRTIFTYYMEPYFASHPGNGFGAEGYVYGGLIYYLSPVVLAAGEMAAADPGRISAMPLPELLGLAKNLVMRHSLEQRLFTAIYAFYAEGKEAALARYTDYASQMPDLFGGTLEGLKNFITQVEQTKASYFDANKKPTDEPEVELSAVNYALLCNSLKAGDASAESELDRLRAELRSGKHNAVKELQRSEEIRNLWKELPVRCRQ